MSRVIVMLFILLAPLTLADTPTPPAAITAGSATNAYKQVEAGVVVISLQDAQILLQEELPEPTTQLERAEPLVQPVPETRVIKLDPAPVNVVNRSRHFRIISRSPVETTEAPANSVEAAEQ